MPLNCVFDSVADAIITSNSTWTDIWSVTLSLADQTYVANFTVHARRPSDGISAAWHKVIVLERTSNESRVLAVNLIDIVTPIKDTAALLWDVRVIVDGLTFTIQGKGGTTNAPVGWFVDGNLHGAKGEDE